MLDRAAKGRKGRPPGQDSAAGADDDPSLMYPDFFNDQMDAEDEDGAGMDTVADGALAEPGEGGVPAQAEPVLQVSAVPWPTWAMSASRLPVPPLLALSKMLTFNSAKPECAARCIGTAQNSSMNWGMCSGSLSSSTRQV